MVRVDAAVAHRVDREVKVAALARGVHQLVQQEGGVAQLGGLRETIWANVRLLSSWHGPQTALKCPHCSDRSDPGIGL